MAHSSQENPSADAATGDQQPRAPLPKKIPVGWWVFSPGGWGGGIYKVRGGGENRTLCEGGRSLLRFDVWGGGPEREDAEAAKQRAAAVHEERHPMWKVLNDARNAASAELNGFNQETQRLKRAAADGAREAASTTDANSASGMNNQ